MLTQNTNSLRTRATTNNKQTINNKNGGNKNRCYQQYIPNTVPSIVEISTSTTVEYQTETSSSRSTWFCAGKNDPSVAIQHGSHVGAALRSGICVSSTTHLQLQAKVLQLLVAFLLKVGMLRGDRSAAMIHRDEDSYSNHSHAVLDMINSFFINFNRYHPSSTMISHQSTTVRLDLP